MLALLGALSAFGPLSIDMYLPSTPTIAANLHASQTLVQLTLSGCLAGLAVGQLVAGPVSAPGNVPVSRFRPDLPVCTPPP